MLAFSSLPINTHRVGGSAQANKPSARNEIRGARLIDMSRFIASICLFAGISFLFAMVPFWTHGLSVQQATTASVVIFPVVFAAFSSYAFWREERHKRQWRERNEGKSPVAPD